MDLEAANALVVEDLRESLVNWIAPVGDVGDEPAPGSGDVTEHAVSGQASTEESAASSLSSDEPLAVLAAKERHRRKKRFKKRSRRPASPGVSGDVSAAILAQLEELARSHSALAGRLETLEAGPRKSPGR